VERTVYRERRKDYPADLGEHNAADSLGALFFILVDMAGANFSTPSGEGNPAVSLITQYDIQYDKRTTSYASCDLMTGSTVYKCTCNHERQLNKTAPCALDSVGVVDLKPYYHAISTGNEPAISTGFEASAAGLGCNWFDDDRVSV
jgi:hypothetical protein